MTSVKGERQSVKCRESSAVVGKPRCAHARAFVTDLYVRASGKNRIQMRRDDDDFLFGRATQFSDDVAGLVDIDGKPCLGEQWFNSSGAFRFLKGRRGDSREACLLVVDPGNIRCNPIKSGADLRVCSKRCSL